MIRLHPRSRLLGTPLLGVEDQHFDLVSLPEIVAQPDDLSHAVSADDRMGTLANRYYGDPRLLYVLAKANGIRLWPFGLLPGAALRIPSPRYISQVWLPQLRAAARTR